VLFVQRARAVDPSFGLNDQNAAAVAEICARLDGLPLAIELATARLKLLSPQAILQRLERRLPLLKGGARDLPERQQTLQNAIAWSYDLLDPPEQDLFKRLGIFLGGWQLPAVEAIVGEEVDVLDGMASLVDKSLIRQALDAGEEPRFWMLETIREFSADRLQESGEREDLARRHAEFFLALAEEAEPHLTAEDQAVWIDGLQREMDNMRSALAWAAETREPEVGFRMGAALWRFWQFRGHLEEGRVQMERLLELPEGTTRTMARAGALDALGSILYWQGDYERSRASYEEALAIYEELGDSRGLATIHYNLGYIAAIEGALDQSLDHYERSRSLAREIGDRKLEAYNGMGLALALQLVDQDRRSIDVAKETLLTLEELGEQWGAANSRGMIGRALINLGEYEEAREWMIPCLAQMRDLGDVPGTTWALDDVANIELGGGNLERALILAGAAEASREALGASAPLQLVQYADPRPKVRDRLDDEAIDRAWNAGRAMTIDHAVAYALEGVPAPS
jgi:tetratricopeptide (TPR) repeat protein